MAYEKNPRVFQV